MKMGNYSSSSGDNSNNGKIKRTKKQIDKEMENKQGLDTTKSWNEEWNAVFHHFIDRNATKLLRTYYAGLVRSWQKKPESTREAELEIASNVIARLSKKF